MTYLLLSFILGFVCGALVFRNNAKKGDALISKVESESEKIIDRYKK